MAPAHPYSSIRLCGRAYDMRRHCWSVHLPQAVAVESEVTSTFQGTRAHTRITSHRSSLVQDALDIVAQNEITKKLLGPPVKVGDVDLADRTNTYVSSKDSHVSRRL